MRPLLVVLLLLAAAPVVTPSLANDTMSQLGTGGLVFLTTEEVKMLSEDLYVSPDAVRVTYQFQNLTDADVSALVAFPLPDITGSPDFMVSVPSEEAENIFGFETRFAGQPVAAELHQSVFVTNIDYTDHLAGLGLPLTPFGQETIAAVNALSDADKAELLHRGLVVPMEFDAGQGWQREFYPVWTLKSAYSWEALFPAGQTVEVTHSYVPSVGGTAGVTFLAEPSEGYDPASTYQRKYCTDESFVAAVRNTLPDQNEPYGAPFTESWISYVWSTGSNWSGPIGTFRLTIDKGRPENLVSFCWDGEVTKTSPTTFEMRANDWWPPYDRELEILILNRFDPETGAAG